MEPEIYSEIKILLEKIIERNLNREAYSWLLDSAKQSADADSNYRFNISFTAMPRKTGKKVILLEESDKENLKNLIPGFSIEGWSIDRLCRVWLLFQLDSGNKANYIKRIEGLFPQAELNEQVALYSALPLLSYPEAWKEQCAIGIRSNISDVLEAIMYFNPYAAEWLDEPAWNQLVMKAFFSGKNVNNIIGIDQRNNQSLANTLFDYVEERWAAHRTEDPQIWRLTGKYLDEKHFYMMEKLFASEDETERQAAALACYASTFDKAKQLLDEHPEYRDSIDKNELTWEMVAKGK